MRIAARYALAVAVALSLCVSALTSCGGTEQSDVPAQGSAPASFDETAIQDVSSSAEDSASQAENALVEQTAALEEATAENLRKDLNITEDFRASFVHGEKGTEHQKYIMLHDTEGESDAASIVQWWDSNGNLVAAHFIVNKDGSIVQCAPLDAIVHHAGFGDTGHNALFGVEDESRDDKAGTAPIGEWAADYGMNSYSIGIEMVHVGGAGDYPPEQLEAVDKLIAYLDAFYGFESQIIDHKEWRSGNSDTSTEFSSYLDGYKTTRTHNS